MARIQRLLRAGLAAAALFSTAATASPSPHGGEHHDDNVPNIAQYCVDGWDDAGPTFCFAANMYHNHSTSAHDLLARVEMHRRAGDVAGKGWLALGSGAVMSGSFMLVIYGDPVTKKGPYVSARGVEVGNGHMQPDVLSQNDASKNHGVLVQQLGEGTWKEGKNGSYVGVIDIACYGCNKWQGHALSAKETSQPMVWAFSEDADMAPYAWDQPLVKHQGANGWGNFYVNMAAATTHHADGAPAIVQGKDKINTSGSRITVKKPSFFEKLKRRPAAYIHGFVMGVAFLALFPLGVVAMRSGAPKAFKYHWTMQVSAVSLAAVGAALGISMSKGNLFGSAHQNIGLAVFALLFVQAASGYVHHVRFVKIQRRTWVSYAHMGVGWAILLGGWSNVITGSVLFGLGKLGLLVLVGCVATELMGLVAIVYIARRKSAQDGARAKAKATAWDQPDEEYFALDEVESEDEDGDATERKSDEKLRPAKYHK